MSIQSPYVGSRPFDAADETIFHGRTDEAAALSKLWRDHRLTILHGPAGVGKTSLLCAGMLPKLGEDPGARVLPLGRLAFPADFPLVALDLNPFTFTLLSSWYPDEPPARMSGSSIRDLLDRRSRGGHDAVPIPVLAAADQADLLFPGTNQRSSQRSRQRRRFVEELVKATDELQNLHLLIAIRTENLQELMRLLIRAGLAEGASVATFSLEAFRPAAARQAVIGPLGDTDHPLVASGRHLVDELAGGADAIDPALLQVVCGRLWADLPMGNRGPIEFLPTVVDQVLADHCMQALATVAGEHGELPRVLTAWFRHVFGRRNSAGVEEGQAATRDLPNAIVHALEDVGLLRVDRDSGPRRYRLRHPRLHAVVRRLDPGAADAMRHGQPRLAAAEAAATAGDLKLAWHRAQAVANESIGDERRRAAAECLLGTIAYDEGRLELAAERYEGAAKAFASLGDTEHVGMLLAAVGRSKIGNDTTEAVNRLRAALTQLPSDLFVKTALAHALWYAGRTQAAIAVLDDALSQDGGTAEALRLRGELLADLNKAEPALRDLDRINYQDRPSTRAAWALAKTREGAGSDAAAELELVDDADDSGPALLRVARVLELRGDAHTAADLADRAVRARRPPLPRHLRKEAERLKASVD
jgi:tetratricopeptide (TPR) repeat protein